MLMREVALRSLLRRSGQRGGAVVQPRHHDNLNLLSRWSPKLSAKARARSVFPQIFAEHWETFQQAHPRYQTRYYDALVHKMLACGNPVKMGCVEYRCLHCGQGEHVVSTIPSIQPRLRLMLADTPFPRGSGASRVTVGTVSAGSVRVVTFPHICVGYC